MQRKNISLGNDVGHEFDLIREMIEVWGELAEGIGSDAAIARVPSGNQVVTSIDSTVEGVHFRREWFTANEVGYRAVAAALSDLAAAAAVPVAVLIAMNVPPVWAESLEELAQGIADAVKAAGPNARIIGGDTSSAGEFSITVTVIGGAAKPLTRAGARSGDQLFVTGDLGRSRRALEDLLAGKEPSDDDRDRFVRPVPRLVEGRWLLEQGATAAIDISDGLASELKHLSAASNANLSVDVDSLNVREGIDRNFALTSGEEYELLVSAPAGVDTEKFQQLFGIPLTRIGEVRSGPAGVALQSRGSAIELPKTGGHSHF